MQATLAFKGGTDIGASLLYRASLEAACYIFLSLVKVKGGQAGSRWIEKTKLPWSRMKAEIEGSALPGTT